jgi:hypothetical protein
MTRTAHSFIVVLLTLSALCCGAETKLDTLKVGSTIYSNVIVMTVTATDICFKHDSGMANTRLRYLEPADRERFHYDAEAAAKAEEKQYPLTPAPAYSPGYSLPWSLIAGGQNSARDNSATKDAAPEFSIADPISESSPLNKTAPDLGVEKWFSEKPVITPGKFTVVLFWRTTSAASRDAVAGLNALQKRFPDTISVVGITSENESSVSQIPDLKIEFAFGSDSQSRLANALGVTSVPSVAVIDSKNILRYVGHPAAVNADALGKLMARYGAE